MRNPILRLELLRRFRGFRAALGIFLALAVPAAAVVVAYATTASSEETQVFMGGFGPAMPPQPMDANGELITQVVDANGTTVTITGGPGMVVGQGFVEPSEELSFRGPPVFSITSVGRKVFGYVGGALLFIVIALVPVLVGGSIAGERANLTLAPLQISRLTPGQIVRGKLGSSLAYLLLVLVCAVPILTVPYLLGGVRLGAILGSLGITVMLAVELAAVSLAASAWLRRPTTAIITAILATGALVVGPFLAMTLGFMVQSRNGGLVAGISSYRLLSSLSPVSLFTWVADGLDVHLNGVGPVRVLSVIWWAVVTLGALTIARRKVTAPVAVDR